MYRSGVSICELFSNIFTTSSPDVQFIDEIISPIEVSITQEMNNHLLASFTEVEVKNDIFQMFPNNASGPDDFPALFYQ